MLLLRTAAIIWFYGLILVLSNEYEMQITSWKPVEDNSTVSNYPVAIINDLSELYNVPNSDLNEKSEQTNDSLDFSNTEAPIPEAVRDFLKLYDSKNKRESDFNSEDIHLEISDDESKSASSIENSSADSDDGDETKEMEMDQTVTDEAFQNDITSNEELTKVELEIDVGVTPNDDDPIPTSFYEPSGYEDLSVSFGTFCDRVNNGTCWIEQTVGETITLGIIINNFHFDGSIEIQWTRLYHQLPPKPNLEIQIEPDRLPWNMVMGSGGLELRLNPVTDGDLDPNAIMAKVFLDITKSGMKKLIKMLEFRIVVTAIEFKRIYAGEELNINLEEYLSLPENGDLTLDWQLEKLNGQVFPLPSNFKVSWSGRLVVVKEIRREHLGVLTCTVYSSNNIAVARRRFLLKKSDSRKPGRLRKRSIRQHRRYAFPRGCLQDARAERMMEYYRIKSRKKRLKSGTSYHKIRGCRNGPYRRRLYPRWIPFRFVEDDADLDSRIISIEKLIDLSEKSDGTLDDDIPHETHFIKPVATVVSDDFADPSAQANCSKDTDCGTGAVCVHPKWKRVSLENSEGFCYCKPEYFGDGFECTKIPRIIREKRIRRSPKTVNNAIKIPTKQFNILEKFIRETKGEKAKISASEKKIIKGMEYEEEDAVLLSTCSDNHDCGQHATCQKTKAKHPFCKCNHGYRGNGIFCWEIMDYFPISGISD